MLRSRIGGGDGLRRRRERITGNAIASVRRRGRVVWPGLFPFALIALLVATGAPARAQPPSPTAQRLSGSVAPGVSPQDLDALIRTLENPKAREQLVKQLRALRVAKEQEAPEKPGIGAVVTQAMSDGLTRFGTETAGLVEQLANVGAVVDWARRQAMSPERRAFWAHTFATLGIVFGAGFAAGLALRLLLVRPRRAVERRRPRSWLRRSELIATRALLDVLPLVAFALAAYAALAFVSPPKAVRLIALAVVNAAIVARAILAVVRVALAPVAPGLRVVRFSDETAAYLFVWAGRLVHVGVYGYFFAETARLLGISRAGEKAIADLIGLVLAAVVFVLVLQNRGAVAAAIRGAPPSPQRPRMLGVLRRRLADVWHVLAALYVSAVYGVWVLGISNGFWLVVRGTLGTVAAFVVARLASEASGRGIGRLFRVSEDLRARFPGLEARVDRYEPVARSVLGFVIYLAAGVAALEAWGAHAAEALASPAGQAVLARLARIGFILLLSVIAWEAARILIARYLEGDEQGNAKVQSARARTLLPLARNVLFVVIAVMASMTILTELGVNIGPLLAGAGVLGLAVGFGAQSLVKDVITGAFILMEDAVSIGDVVDVEGSRGWVEAMTIRSIRFRDLAGTVHTVPFSSVGVVRNLTKDFSYYLMDIGVAYRENTDEVVEVIRAIVDEMREEPAYGPVILEPLEVLGVNSFDDSAVTIRARIKTKPLEQWRVGREFNRRMKHRFDELGIEIPFPHRTLYFGVDKDGTAPAARLRLQKDASAEADASEPRKQD